MSREFLCPDVCLYWDYREKTCMKWNIKRSHKFSAVNTFLGHLVLVGEDGFWLILAPLYQHLTVLYKSKTVSNSFLYLLSIPYSSNQIITNTWIHTQSFPQNLKFKEIPRVERKGSLWHIPKFTTGYTPTNFCVSKYSSEPKPIHRSLKWFSQLWYDDK